MGWRGFSAATALVLMSGVARAGSFTVIGADQQLQPRGLSTDGSVLVGAGLAPPGTLTLGMTWTASQGLDYMLAAGASANYSEPNAASNHAGAIVGYNQDVNDIDTAWRYTAATGYQFIGPTGFASSIARDVSADGNTVVGLANNGNQYSDFVWTSRGNITVLPYSGGGPLISADGSTVVGESSAPTHFTQAFTWTMSGGVQYWNSLPNADNIGISTISADGSRVFGEADGSDNSPFVFEYTGGQMTSLGIPTLIGTPTIDGTNAVNVAGASDDGAVLVGTELALTSVSDPPTQLSWVWTAAGGYTTLSDYLAAAGVDRGGESDLSITGISPDGTTLYGSGLEDGIEPSTWVAVVPEPSSLLAMIGGALVMLIKRKHRGKAFWIN